MPYISQAARILAALVAVVCSASAAPAIPNTPLVFAVIRDGSEIGTHELDFRNTDNGMQVDITTKVAVKVAFITAYRFEHEGHEIWQGDRLIHLWSRTNDDGTKHVLEAVAHGSQLQVIGDGKEAAANPDIIPASLWNVGILRGGAILNTLDGSRMKVSVADLGPETINARGASVAARHYKISGELEREVWYDSQNTLVKIHFVAKDGTGIDYVLR